MTSRSEGRLGNHPQRHAGAIATVFLRATLLRTWGVTVDGGLPSFALWDTGKGSLMFLRYWGRALIEALSGPRPSLR